MIAPAEQAHHAGTAPTAAPFGFSHVTVVTPDLDRFRAFYEAVIGLRTAVVVRTTVPPELRHAIILVNDASIVHAFEVPGYDPAAAGMGGEMFSRGRLDHLGFMVASVAELEALRDRLVAVGASDGTVVSHGPVLAVHFVDPDGLEGDINAVNLAWDPSQETNHEVEEEPDPEMYARLVAAAAR